MARFAQPFNFKNGIGMFLIVLLSTTTLVLNGCPLHPAAPPNYSIIKLDSRESSAEALNEQGEVVGQVKTAPDQWRGFLWRADHTPKLMEFPTFGGDYGLAGGINEYTEVAGYANTSEFWTHAFHWTETGGMQDLGALGVGYSAALDVNNKGEVVGHTGYTDGTRRAFLWTTTSGMNVIPGAVEDTYATAISESSTTVGAIHDEANIGTADPPLGQVWHSDGTVETTMNTLGGAASIALDVNTPGTVVGFADNASAEFRAFKWTTATGMQDLGTLGYCNTGDFDVCSVATAVNFYGHIVGSAAVAGGRAHAVLWKGGTLYDLNNLIPTGTKWEYLADAADINDKDCIVGRGFIRKRTGLQSAAYLLVPVVLRRLTTSSAVVTGGESIVATVYLDAEAPILLNVNVRLKGLADAARLTKATVSVAEGSRSASFTIVTQAVESERSGSVIASFGGNSFTAPITISP